MCQYPCLHCLTANVCETCVESEPARNIDDKSCSCPEEFYSDEKNS